MSIIHDSVFLAEGSIVIGDVTIKENSSIWFHAVVRAERDTIEIGAGSNIQDNCVVHVDKGHPVKIGDGVTIGHGAIIHGCSIGDNTLIGMGAVIMNGAKIGKNCIIAAGALVTQNTVIEDGSMVLGSPGKVRRKLDETEIEHNRKNALMYVDEAKEYRQGLFS